MPGVVFQDSTFGGAAGGGEGSGFEDTTLEIICEGM
jgi:hypothetical protein